MKNITKVIITGTLFAFIALAGSVQAQTKIGTMNLRTVFDNYYKTKQADVLLKEEAGDLEKELKSMIEGMKKRESEYKELIDKANDQAVSADERAKSKKAAEQKFAELKEMDQAAGEFRRSAQAKIEEKQRLKREAIVAEIRAVVAVKAKAANYSLVVDIAGESVNRTSFVLFTNGENDMTEAVLTELNSTAPPTSKLDEKKPEAKPDSKPESKPKK